MNLNPRVKISLIIAGSVLIVGAAAFALIYPQITKSTNLAVEQAAAESNLLKARALLATRTALASNSAKTKSELAMQEAKVPQTAEIATVLRTIQDMAYENNHWLFEISNTAPETTKDTFYNTWESKIVVEGSWLDTLSFLRKLRDMDRQVRVTQVDLSPVTTIRGGGTIANRVAKHWDPEEYPVRAVITCNFYFIPEESVKESMKVVPKDAAESSAQNSKNTQGGAAK